MAGLKPVVKKVVPDRVIDQVRKRRAAIQPIDLSRVELIRAAPLERLTDPEWLEHDLLPKLGLNGEWLEEFPSALYPYAGQGLRHWQYPIQFSKYLCALSRYRIDSYLEIGARHGGTFVITVEYLRRFHPLRQAVAVDLALSPSLVDYQRLNPSARFLQANSRSRRFRRFVEEHGPFDLVLVDGDHLAEGITADLQTMEGRARILALHDIASGRYPDVGAVWRRMRATADDEFEFLEFTGQYDEAVERMGRTVMGIGLAVPRDYAAACRAPECGNTN